MWKQTFTHVHLSCIYSVLQKTSSLTVCWKTKGSPPNVLSHLLTECGRMDLLKRTTSGLVHLAEYKEDGLPQGEIKDINMTLTLASQYDCLSLLDKPEDKRRVISESFDFLHTDFAMELGKKCEDYIAVYTGKNFVRLSGDGKFCPQLEGHPMMKAVEALSRMTLKTFGCSGLKTVITKKNVIYVALFYMNNTPAYYVGKASGGIEERWCTTSTSHCKFINIIMRCFEHSPGHFEPVVHHQLCDLAIAGAVLKRMAEISPDGVALFAVDFCPGGVVKCCNPDHQNCTKKPKSIDHYEQHYMNAFKELFPDSDTEPTMKCLNAMESTLCHRCSYGNVNGCSMEIAISLFLHDQQLA